MPYRAVPLRDLTRETHDSVARGPRGLDAPDDLPVTERPTIPAPPARESGVRLKVQRAEYGSVTVDVVVADLSRDPRSESYAGRAGGEGEDAPRSAGRAEREDAPQNERPPSTSIVRALK